MVKLVIKKVMVVKKSHRSRSKVTMPNRLLRLPATLIILLRTKLLVRFVGSLIMRLGSIGR